MSDLPMAGNRWFAIAVATLVWAVSFWFGLLALSTERVTAFAIMGVGLVFALYALTAFGGVDGALDTAFRASLAALATASVLVIAALAADDDRVAVAAAILAPGVGATLCLAPTGDRARIGLRLVAVAVLAVIGVALYGTDSTVFGLLAPLYVMPLLAVADGYLDRVRSAAADG